MSWQPVLDAELEEQARATLSAIVHALHAAGEAADVSLAYGRAGHAVLLAQLAQDPVDLELAERAATQLTAAAASAAVSPLSLGLYGGFTGVAWAKEQMRHLRSLSDGNAQIDVRLLTALERSPWRGHFDLVNGLVGLGVYLLERIERPIARACLEQLVSRLEENATRDATGIRWHTAPALLSPEARAAHPHGYYDLGLAHGLAGVIALLGKLSRANVARAQCERLLEGAVQWLLAQAITGEAAFPSYIVPDTVPEPAPTAWRAGDPGIAAALMIAARGTGQRRWAVEAQRIALQSCKRPNEHTGVVDAGVSHGAAGLAHIYSRFYHATGEPLFRDSARAWYRRALAMRTPADGLAGFLAWRCNAHGTQEWTRDRSLLSGVIGIALCLHAAISHVEPTWDRLLLVDLPSP